MMRMGSLLSNYRCVYSSSVDVLVDLTSYSVRRMSTGPHPLGEMKWGAVEPCNNMFGTKC